MWSLELILKSIEAFGFSEDEQSEKEPSLYLQFDTRNFLSMLLLVSADTSCAARWHHLKNLCCHCILHTRETGDGQNIDSSNQCLGAGYIKNSETHQYMKFSPKTHSICVLIALYKTYSSLQKMDFLLRALVSKQEFNFHRIQIEVQGMQLSQKNQYSVTRMLSFILGWIQYELGKSAQLTSLQEYMFRSEISSEQTSWTWAYLIKVTLL